MQKLSEKVSGETIYQCHVAINILALLNVVPGLIADIVKKCSVDIVVSLQQA